jgi:hypothetical protein
LKGPFAIPDIHGRRFAMGFIDEATGRSDVFYMHAKTDAVTARRQWESNTMHIGPTKRYRTDNRSEFIDQKFRDDIIASGSSIEFTAPYTHHPLLMERLWRQSLSPAQISKVRTCPKLSGHMPSAQPFSAAIT